MPTCGTRALRYFFTSIEAVRAGDVCAHNGRYLSTEASRRLLQINSFTPQNQPASNSVVSTLQPHQPAGRHTALSLSEDTRPREEPFYCAKNGSTIRVDPSDTLHENLGRVEEIATISVALRSRQDSMMREGFPKSRRWPKNRTFVDQSLLKAAMKVSGRRSYATCLVENDSMHEEKPGSIKLAGFGRRAPLRDYSSRTSEGGKAAITSARSAKVSAESRVGAPRYKDQREPWQTQKKALSEKFGPTGWLPRKRLSPDSLEGIRALHAQYPEKFTTPILADQFKVSPEAIRRILRSKWRPNDEEEEGRRRRWEKRGENIWSQMFEVGIKPPKKWRDMGVGKSRERLPTRSKQLEPRNTSKSITSSFRGQTVTDSNSITANGHKTDSTVLLADRIL